MARSGVAPAAEAAVVVVVEAAAVGVALDHLAHLQQGPLGPSWFVGGQTAACSDCNTARRQGEDGFLKRRRKTKRRKRRRRRKGNKRRTNKTRKK